MTTYLEIGFKTFAWTFLVALAVLLIFDRD